MQPRGEGLGEVPGLPPTQTGKWPLTRVVILMNSWGLERKKGTFRQPLEEPQRKPQPLVSENKAEWFSMGGGCRAACSGLWRTGLTPA